MNRRTFFGWCAGLAGLFVFGKSKEKSDGVFIGEIEPIKSWTTTNGVTEMIYWFPAGTHTWERPIRTVGFVRIIGAK